MHTYFNRAITNWNNTKIKKFTTNQFYDSFLILNIKHLVLNSIYPR